MTLVLLSFALGAGFRINEVTASQCDQQAPGVGLEACEALTAWREEHGELESAEDLADVPGLGEASRRLLARADFASARERIWPEQKAAEPVDLNTASVATLADLPGIGAAKAADIVRFRDEIGPFASCDELARLPGMGRATVAGLGERCTVAAPASP